MKFKGSGSKGTLVIERKQSVTDGQTDRRTRQKQYVSLRGGGRHNRDPLVMINFDPRGTIWATLEEDL